MDSLIKQTVNNHTLTTIVHDGNWDIMQDEKGTLWAIAVDSQCKDSFFASNIQYLVGLIYKYNNYKQSDFTPEGLAILEKHLEARKYTLNDLFKTA